MLYLVDTDLVIDYLRGIDEAIAFLETQPEPLLLSVISVAEIHSCVRDEPERAAIESFLRAFDVVDLSAPISVLAGAYRREYGPSHGVGLADAFIAASAATRGATIVTPVRRRFPMFDREEVLVPYVGVVRY